MVECQLPKLNVAGSNPVSRSNRNGQSACCKTGRYPFSGPFWDAWAPPCRLSLASEQRGATRGAWEPVPGWSLRSPCWRVSPLQAWSLEPQPCWPWVWRSERSVIGRASGDRSPRAGSRYFRTIGRKCAPADRVYADSSAIRMKPDGCPGKCTPADIVYIARRRGQPARERPRSGAGGASRAGRVSATERARSECRRGWPRRPRSHAARDRPGWPRTR